MPQAMILAAGRGERLRPHTDLCPKPLLNVQGKPLIEWQVDALWQAGFDRLVINGAWLSEQLESFVGRQRDRGLHIDWSPEERALGTAGGVAQALTWLTDDVFALVSADIFTNYDYRLLKARCEQGMESDTTVAHLVLVHDARYPTDFYLDERGRIGMAGDKGGTYGNMGLFRRDFFSSVVVGATQELGPLLREAACHGHLSGEWANCHWVNVGKEADLSRAEALRMNRGG